MDWVSDQRFKRDVRHRGGHVFEKGGWTYVKGKDWYLVDKKELS